MIEVRVVKTVEVVISSPEPLLLPLSPVWPDWEPDDEVPVG